MSKNIRFYLRMSFFLCYFAFITLKTTRSFRCVEFSCQIIMNKMRAETLANHPCGNLRVVGVIFRRLFNLKISQNENTTRNSF